VHREQYLEIAHQRLPERISVRYPHATKATRPRSSIGSGSGSLIPLQSLRQVDRDPSDESRRSFFNQLIAVLPAAAGVGYVQF
jgi:hypothetical protein